MELTCHAYKHMHQQLVLPASGQHADLVGRQLPCCRLGSAAFDSRLGKSDVIIGPDGARPARLHQLQELCQLRIICRARHLPLLGEEDGTPHCAVPEDKLISLKYKGGGLGCISQSKTVSAEGPTRLERKSRQDSSVLT